MKPKTGNTLLGGVFGTAAITLMMYLVAPLMMGKPMDVAAMLAGMLGTSWGTGMLIHILNGVVIFPLLYSLVVYGMLPGSPAVKGLLWGLVLWLMAELVVVPTAGGGIFHSQMGGLMAVIAGFLGHSVYGLILGSMAGRPQVGHEDASFAAEHGSMPHRMPR